MRGWVLAGAALCIASTNLACAQGSDTALRETLSGGGQDTRSVGQRIATWGSVGAIWEAGTRDDGVLLHNLLEYLAEDNLVGDEKRFLYTADCDPRTDANLCRYSDSIAQLQPFFDMIAEIEPAHDAIAFKYLKDADLTRYSAVIADFCTIGDDDPKVLTEYVKDGRALILADNFCGGVETANAITGPLGLTFAFEPAVYDETDAPDYGPWAIPPEDQKGLLKGVRSVDLFRVAPQTIQHGFAPVLSKDGDVRSARLDASTSVQPPPE